MSDRKIIHDGRKYVRHPTSVPIEVSELSETDHHIQQLHNISVSGLAFESEVAWQEGSLIMIRVLMDEPPIELRGKVVWCHKQGDHFEVGVQFSESQNKLELQDKVVEEVCQIEIYLKLIGEIVSWETDDSLEELGYTT